MRSRLNGAGTRRVHSFSKAEFAERSSLQPGRDHDHLTCRARACLAPVVRECAKILRSISLTSTNKSLLNHVILVTTTSSGIDSLDLSSWGSNSD